jgi:hypothetical protein
LICWIGSGFFRSAWLGFGCWNGTLQITPQGCKQS